MSLFFDPSEQLSSAYDRQDRFLQILEDAPYDPSTSQRYVEQVRGQLRAVEREIAERESVEEQEHERRLSEHRKSELEYSRSVRLWNQKAKQAQQWRESMARRSQIVQGVSRRIEHAFKLGAVAPTSRIQWQPLSPHQATPERIRGHYHKRLQREGRLDKFDQTRLDAATALPYEEWWVPTEGFGGFDAYSIISFSHTNKVLLECPIYGNAAYVIDANEEVWREMKKHELIESGLAEKIPHQGENWPAKIRQALDLE